ncbi:two-partner secretion domain-containing protein [Kamptonema formosum]|uniref:two-partner secretion domain-containing protein n=1 Tax=Kamptonema formosum TaxID=331992 RepID=UPI00034AE3CF|nr:filamentous hemagglutinin N-terminal domain-containing protein [Oscillatoria sp. PCC 10802]
MKQGIPIWIFGSLAIACLETSRPISAQIVPDATMPVNSTVTPQGNTVTITGGTNAGANLFHSFREFSLPAGSTAHFNNSPDIQNIITRVTGGSISNIDGRIKANGSANLFLLNPSGIIFGPNASLNIGGSFLASTASSIKFADGNQFSATNPTAPPLLTVNVPVGLQLGQNPGEIVVRGAGNNMSLDPETYAIIRDNRSAGLQVSAGKTLSLLGGNISLVGGNITAEGGRIELGSAGAGSYVSLIPNSAGWALEYSGVQNFQDIQLSQAASADASGRGGGNIQVAARQLLLSDGSAIFALTQGAEPGGTLSVRASESVDLRGASPDTQVSSTLTANTYSTGSAGNLTVETRRLTLQDGAGISASTTGAGDGGSVTLKASESVELTGTNAGSRLPARLSAVTFSTGRAGNLTVETARLTVRDGAGISASTFGAGDGGSVSVRAAESVEAAGTSPDGETPSGFAAQAEQGSTGRAGNLTIETARLSLRNGAAAGTATFGAGDGGSLTVIATESAELAGTATAGDLSSGLYAAGGLNSTGNGGSLTLETARLTVRDGARVSVRSRGTGTARNLTVRASTIRLDTEALLTAETSAGDGGNITLHASDIQLRRGSNITTSAQGTATGGNITITADTLVALENSDISANAEQSFGGRVTVSATGIFGTKFRDRPSPDSDITASSQLGSSFSGTVTLNTPDINPAAGLVELQSNLVDVSRLIDSSCQTHQSNSFTVTGSGGILPAPSDPLSGTAPAIEWASPQPEAPAPPTLTREIPKSPNPGSPPPLAEAQGWVISPAGTVTLTANPSTGTPHPPWQPPANCPASR